MSGRSRIRAQRKGLLPPNRTTLSSGDQFFVHMANGEVGAAAIGHRLNYYVVHVWSEHHSSIAKHVDPLFAMRTALTDFGARHHSFVTSFQSTLDFDALRYDSPAQGEWEFTLMSGDLVECMFGPWGTGFYAMPESPDSTSRRSAFRVSRGSNSSGQMFRNAITAVGERYGSLVSRIRFVTKTLRE